jgi:carboxynorspermidine decarboxylase
MTAELLSLLDGLHFHTLCEQDADALAKTMDAVGKKFSDILPKMKWLNMGGGHHITRPNYNISLLEQTILAAKRKWNIEVYLEPGEAVALNAGYLVSKVIDVVENDEQKIAILDTSAACHMPDVIEMPYRPPLYQMSETGYAYRLAGPTCLAGDIIGDYNLSCPLKENDMLVFGDMAIYTTCKNNTFNGMPLPDIWKWSKENNFQRITEFGYDDFKQRLG